MGNCCGNSGSQTSEQHLSDGMHNSSSRKNNSMTGEDKIEIAFRAKRANVYTSNALEGDEETGERMAFVLKNIPKKPKEKNIILNAIKANYIFAGLNEDDLNTCVNAMEIVDVASGENIVVQGQNGNYFYVISSGSFSVLLNQKPVSKYEAGESFGELALLYNSPRQATIKANKNSVVFSLDRETYRFIVAQSSNDKSLEIIKFLRSVPLLKELTEEQVNKISDAVELFPYSKGDNIITKGEAGSIFYMIKEGSVLVTALGENFEDTLLGAGDYFGERALLTGEPRAATCVAQNAVTLLALDRAAFNSLLGPLTELLNDNFNLKVINSVSIFSKLSQPEKVKLSQSFTLKSYPTGTKIIKEGERGTIFYILKNGTADVQKGEKKIVQLKSGSYFGEMALLGDGLRKSSIVAVTDCDCFILEKDEFTRILSSIQQVLQKDKHARLLSIDEDAEDMEPDLTYNFNDLKPIAMLGSGTFGRVSLVQEATTQNVYALKVMQKYEIVAHKQQVNVINEKKVMKRCQHPFILRLHQTFKDTKKLCMLLEFIQGGELFSVLHTANSDGVPEASAKFYGAAIILAISYMHNKNIAYRDMKPENCLIDSNGYPKLVDFGFAKEINGKSFTLCGTPEYLAPELVLAKGHTKAVDYWAFGVLVYEMIAGYSPFSDPQGMDQVVICRNIINGRLYFPKVFQSDAKDIVKKLLTREVQNRLGNLKNGSDDISGHKWFSSVDFSAILNSKIKAPWVPKIKSKLDTSNFDPYDMEDEPSNNYVDHGNWDKEF